MANNKLDIETIKAMGLNERRNALKTLQSSPLRLTPEFQEKIRLIQALDTGKVYVPRETQKTYRTSAHLTYTETKEDPSVLFDLNLLKVPELRKLAGESGIKGIHRMRKAQLIEALQA